MKNDKRFRGFAKKNPPSRTDFSRLFSDLDLTWIILKCNSGGIAADGTGSFSEAHFRGFAAAVDADVDAFARVVGAEALKGVPDGVSEVGSDGIDGGGGE